MAYVDRLSVLVWYTKLMNFFRLLRSRSFVTKKKDISISDLPSSLSESTTEYDSGLRRKKEKNEFIEFQLPADIIEILMYQ